MGYIEELHPLVALRLLQLISPADDVPAIDYNQPDNVMRCALIEKLLSRAALILPELSVPYCFLAGKAAST